MTGVPVDPIPGVGDRTNRLVAEVLGRYPNVESVVLFGSRALGNAKPGSDIDLAVDGGHLTAEAAQRLGIELNERIASPDQFGKVLKTPTPA